MRTVVEPKLKSMQLAPQRTSGGSSGCTLSGLDTVSCRRLLTASATPISVLHRTVVVGTRPVYAQPVSMPLCSRIRTEGLWCFSLSPQAHPQASIEVRSLNTSDIQTLHGESKTTSRSTRFALPSVRPSIAQVFQRVTGKTFMLLNEKGEQITPSCRQSEQTPSRRVRCLYCNRLTVVETVRGG